MYRGKFERGNRAPGKKAAKMPGKKRFRRGSPVFYSLFFLFILLFCGASFFGLCALHGWLTRYELAQPSTKSEAVFRQLFADPDWGTLYDLAQDHSNEDRETFVTRMESVVGNAELTYMETSTGLSEDKKYIVRLGKEKIASFTLVNHNQGTAQTDIPDWELGTVTFLLKQQTRSYFVQKTDGHTVYVNGTPLDDSATVEIHVPRAESYLPVGVSGIRTCIQEITGLAAAPEVKILDGNGNAVEVTYDEASRTFIEQTKANAIGEQERETAFSALKTYALYMMKQANRADIAKYFLKDSDAYRAITDTELGFVQEAASFDFTNETVSDFCCYSDTLFSARVSVTLNQHRKDGTVKESAIEQSLFFEKQSSGGWLCYAMTAEDVAKESTLVRLTFQDGDTVLQSDFFDADALQLQCPVVTAPAGKQFSGWITETENEAGETVKTLVLQPDETGKASLPAGNRLEPMTLMPLFE